MLKSDWIDDTNTILEGFFDGKPSEANKYKQSLKSKIAKLQRWDHAEERASDGKYIKYDDLIKLVEEW